jgi:hypothetical protein
MRCMFLIKTSTCYCTRLLEFLSGFLFRIYLTGPPRAEYIEWPDTVLCPLKDTKTLENLDKGSALHTVKYTVKNG